MAIVTADTSVWVDYLNGKDNHHTQSLDSALAQGHLVMLDVVVMELLQGIRCDNKHKQVKQLLSALPCHEIMNVHYAHLYSDFYRKLRKKGITIRKSNDVMIAGFCLHHRLPLIFHDRDFHPFVTHLGLIAV